MNRQSALSRPSLAIDTKKRQSPRQSTRITENQRKAAGVQNWITGHAFREVIFDRKKIRSKLDRLDIIEARRIRGPIFDVLYDELYQAGCRVVPEFIRCLAAKEEALFSSISIRHRFSDDRPLLYKFIDMLKDAELSAIVNRRKNLRKSYVLCYEVITLLEPYGVKYDWVLVECYRRLVRMCLNIEGQEYDAAELIARILYKYGCFQAKSNKSKSVFFLKKALNLVRGQKWPSEHNYFADPLLLHELVAQKLSEVLLQYGEQIIGIQPDVALDLARKATLVIAEVGRRKYETLYCATFLTKAKFLIELDRHSEALQILDRIKPIVLARNDYCFVKLCCDFFLYEGQCLDNVNCSALALKSFDRCLRISRIYELKRYEAETVLSMGKIHAKDIQSSGIAKQCYETSKKLFIDINDIYNKKKALYLLAKLKTDDIQSTFMAMLKKIPDYYCALFNLRQWKNRCRPFWSNLAQEIVLQKKDSIYCLIHENEEDAYEAHMPWNILDHDIVEKEKRKRSTKMIE